MVGSPIILVHGTGLGAWAWEPAAQILEAAGRSVRAIDLKGLGARAEELAPTITLADHVADVTDAIDETEDTVLLVGHSYGSYVAGEAAAARPSRVTGLVLIDGPLTKKGESLLDQVPELAPLFERLATKDVPGLIEALPAELLGLAPEQLPPGIVPTRSPIQPSLDPATHSVADLKVPGHFVGFKDFPPSAGFAAGAKEAGWPVTWIEGGHMTVFTAPALVAEVILKV